MDYGDFTTGILDDSTMSQLLLSMPYDEMIAFAFAYPKYQIILDDPRFWNLKLQKDYNHEINPKSPKSPQQQYFEEFDLIRDDDDIDDIFWAKLRKLETESKDLIKIHFSGGFGSSLTTFEELSNDLKIAVIAKNSIFASATLRIIRFYVDKSRMYDHAAGLIKEDGNHLTYTNLILKLAEQENQYVNEYDLRENFTATFKSRHIVKTLTRDITEIDLWTLPRMDENLNIDIIFDCSS